MSDNWLGPYCAAYDAVRGPMSHRAIAGQLARYLKPLIAVYDEATLTAALTRYLRTNDSRYGSIARFAASVGDYLPEVEPVTPITLVQDGWLSDEGERLTR